MAGNRELHLVIVTPEQTVYDQPVSRLRFPLFDGDFGVLPGRAPVVGRLGAGELRIATSSGELSYFIDGGFVQISGPTVTLLTDRAIPAAQLDVSAAQKNYDQAVATVAKGEEAQATRQKSITRARKMLDLARRTPRT